MKKIIILLFALIFSSSVFAYELPSNKTIDKNAVQKGIETYTLKIQTNPNSEDAYINRAYLYFLTDNLESAISDYDSLIRLNPQNEEFYLNRGYLKHISHKREEARKDYEMALRIKPNYAFAYNNLGVVLSELGRTADSLTAYNTAIKINPNYADAYYNRGNLKTKTEKNEEALEDFNTAIKLNPTDSASFNNRGVVKRKLNFNIGALSDFSIAIKLNPEDITAFANRGRLKKRYYDSEGAEEDFKTAIAIAEESPVLIKEIEVQSQIATTQKQTTEQKPLLREPKVTPEHIQKIAYQQNTAKQEDNVKLAAVKASVVKVTPKTTTTQQSSVSTELPKPISAKQEPAITTKPVANPKLAECYFIRALQKYILQNRESALNDFNMAIQHNPDYAEAYYYRAAIKRDLQDEGFVDDYRRAVQLNPSLKAVNDADVLTILKI